MPGMLKLPADLCFFHEPLDQLGFGGMRLEQHLEGEVSPEIDVSAFQHRTHTSAGDLAEKLVPIGLLKRHLARRGFDEGRRMRLDVVSRNKTCGNPPTFSASSAKRLTALAPG